MTSDFAAENPLRPRRLFLRRFIYVIASLLALIGSFFGTLSLLGIYGSGLEVSRQLGDVFACVGSFDSAVPVAGEKDFLRVGGWIFDPDANASPKSITFIDANGAVVGLAKAGGSRPDVARAVNPKAELSGFSGYVMASANGKELTAIGDEPRCKVSFRINARVP